MKSSYEFNLNLDEKPNLDRWINISKIQQSSEGNVIVGIVGKYTSMIDSYKSFEDSVFLEQADQMLMIKWIDSELLENKDCSINDYLKEINAIIVPGGYKNLE